MKDKFTVNLLNIFGVYRSVRGQSDTEKDQALELFRQEVGEEKFHHQMMLFADHIQREQYTLQNQIEETVNTPAWLFEPWINLDEVCLRLYGSQDEHTVSGFMQKRDGLVPWQPEELKQLDGIRQKLAESLVT